MGREARREREHTSLMVPGALHRMVSAGRRLCMLGEVDARERRMTTQGQGVEQNVYTYRHSADKAEVEVQSCNLTVR